MFLSSLPSSLKFQTWNVCQSCFDCLFPYLRCEHGGQNNLWILHGLPSTESLSSLWNWFTDVIFGKLCVLLPLERYIIHVVVSLTRQSLCKKKTTPKAQLWDPVAKILSSMVVEKQARQAEPTNPGRSGCRSESRGSGQTKSTAGSPVHSIIDDLAENEWEHGGEGLG